METAFRPSDEATTIRPAGPRDAAAIGSLVRAAFGGTAEADLVEALRRSGAAAVELVAESPGGVILGHVLFSEVTVEPDALCPLPASVPRIAGLAPLAVLPEAQRHGVGTKLTHDGLARCRESSFGAAVVLGHPEYYPRFGFRPASRFGLRSIYPVRDEAFMALELHPGALDGVRGLVRYRPEFDGF